MATLPKDTEARLALIVENRTLAGRLDLLANQEPKTTKRLMQAAAQALKEVRKDLRLGTITDFQENRLKAQAKWLHIIREDIQAVLDDVLPGLRDDLKQVATKEVQTLSDVLSFDGQIQTVNSVSLTASQLTAITNVPVGGYLLEDWVSDLGKKLANRIGQELRVAALRGEGYRKMMNRLNRVAGGELTRSQCITIARTTTQTAANEAARLVYEKNAHVIKGLRWSATLDNRSCKRCAAMDGKVWYSGPIKTGHRAIKTMPDIPLHPRCRCVGIPVTKSWTELLGIEDDKALDKIERKYRPFSIRGKYKRDARVTSGKAGQVKQVDVGGAEIEASGQTTAKTSEAYLRQFPDVAIDVLGKKRADLLLSGKLTLNDMLDQTVLRLGTVRYKTLKQLGKQ